MPTGNMAKLEFEKEREPPILVCMETAQFRIEGIFPACSLTRVGSNIHESRHVTPRADRAEIQCSNASAHVLLSNFNEENLTIFKATILGITEEVVEHLMIRLNSTSQTETRRLLGHLVRRKAMLCTTSFFMASYTI